jgi:two-component system LytT family sensor kinase
MSELLNLVGLSTGVVLYTMLLAMVVRAGRTTSGPSRIDPLLLVTSILGLVWNLCALPAYELPKVGIAGPFPSLIAVGFSALGFLPAVVVHSVLRGERDGVRGAVKRSIATLAYAVAALAAMLHLASAWQSGPVPSVLGMRLLTYTFVALILPLAAVTRGQPGARRALWAAALATFAVSALHLSQLHTGDASWPVELIGHHASVPLALAILYQDYPFALADLFLKRALALLSIVTLAFIAIAAFGVWSPGFGEFMRLDPRQVGALVTLWVATALLYPAMRTITAWFVDAIVLDRPDYGLLRTKVARCIQAQDEVPPLLTNVCELLRPALNSREISWRELDGEGDDQLIGSLVLTGARDGMPNSLAARVIVPVSEPPRYAISIAELTRGRRLLSDDVGTLEAIAVMVARRIDVLRIARERFHREIREQEMMKLATEAELRALRAQINPHFLFNALTTIGYLIQTAPGRALDTLLRLTSLLRGVLRSEGESTTLGRELEIVESYLDIERARFEERLRVHIEVPDVLRQIAVPPLLLQPLVENAVKHGIAPSQLGGQVTVRACLGGMGSDADSDANYLSLSVEDTGIGATERTLQLGRETGVGLRNIERRLAGQYGAAASLSIRSSPGAGTTITVRLPVESAVAPGKEHTWTAR